MDITGKVVKIGTLTEGSSARGAWRKQELIIETDEQYPRKVCMLCWNDRVEEANKFVPGQMITAHISIESREFNNKWYTDVRVIRFDNQPMAQPAPNNTFVSRPAVSNVPDESAITASDESDDLPF